MNYYYLDGLEKKGPYKPHELISRKLTQDTLVLSEGMTNWKPVKEVPELYSLLFEVPNETQSEILSTYIEQNIGVANNIPSTTTPVTTKAEIKKIKIPTVIFLIIGILIPIGISYLIVQGQRTADKNILDKTIDALFQGKDEICDYQKTGVQGKLQDVVIGPLFDMGPLLKELESEKNSVKAGNTILAIKPEAPPSDTNDFENNFSHKQKLKNWNSYKELVEYFKCSSGGFTVQALSRKNNGFELIKSYSKDMGFKVPASRYMAGVDYGYGLSTQGYSIPTNRGSVQEAYNGAMEYLSKDKENKSYKAGTYDKIKSFDEIRSEFYFIENVEPTKFSSSSVFAKSWKSFEDAYVYNTDWIVWYAYEGKHYEIFEDKKLFYKRWAIYSGIGVLLAFIIYFGIRYRRKITLQLS